MADLSSYPLLALIRERSLIDDMQLEEIVAEHRRIWSKEAVSFDPVHYLALLERKPGALDFARHLAKGGRL